MSEPAIRSVEDIQHPPSPKLNGNTIVSQADDMEYDDEYESEISGSQQINGSQMHQSLNSIKKKRLAAHASSSGASCEIILSNRKSNGFNEVVRLGDPPS